MQYMEALLRILMLQNHLLISRLSKKQQTIG